MQAPGCGGLRRTVSAGNGWRRNGEGYQWMTEALLRRRTSVVSGAKRYYFPTGFAGTSPYTDGKHCFGRDYRMATKESKKRRQTAQRKEQRRRSLPGGTGLVRELLLPFVISLALSRAVVLGSCVPFSLGWTAAAGVGAAGTAALAGSLLAYVALLPTAQALRCCACVILTYTLTLSCLELRVFRRSWFLASSSALIVALTGFVYQSGAGWSPEQAIRLGSEVLLSFLTCLLLRRFTPREGETPGREALVLWSALGTAALAGLWPPLGATAAALAALTAARTGSGAGAVTGVVTGLVVGLGGGGSPLLAGVLGVSGSLAGTRRGRHRLEMVLVFAASGVLSALWTRGGGMTALACTAAAVVFSALPEGLLQRADRLMGAGELRTPAPVPRFSALERTGHRLEEQARSYHCLWEHIAQSLEGAEPGEESAVIFERTMERVCTGCFLYQVCWQRDYSITCRGLTQVLEAMLERGNARLSDFPDTFRRRCGRVDEFLRVSNEELYGHWARQRSRERLRESRRAVCGQYEELSRLLSAAADQLREEVTEDATGAATVQRALEERGVEARCTLQLDQRGRRTLEVRGKSVARLREEEGVRVLSGALGVRMEPGESFRVRQGEQLVFHQCPPLSATVAVASRGRREGQANGDNGLWFRDDEGMLWVALCDGMGSGSAAARDSRLLTTLLKDFLRAGVGAAAALSTLSGALGLAGELDGGFTTVDLLRLDLFTGAAELYKMGGAPTYLRRGGLVSRIAGRALPAGLEREGVADESRFRLSAEDYVLLVTDGITDGGDDQWLRTLLERYDGESSRELAQAVLSSPAAGREDDRTVVALRLARRLS